MNHPLKVARAKYQQPKEMIKALADKLGQNSGVTYLFCSSELELDEIGKYIPEFFKGAVVCCSCASEIFHNQFIEEKEIVGLSLSSDVCECSPFFISNLDDKNELRKTCENIRKKILSTKDSKKLLGMMLIDGLSLREDWTTQAIYSCSDGVPLIGGSASDPLKFLKTHVYHDGEFHENACLYALLELEIDFEVFKTQHFYPTQSRFIITKTDETKRVVYEINSLPAATAYAELLGINKQDLTNEVIAQHPLMLKLGGENFIRSLQKQGDDESLTFYGSVQEGVVYRIGQSYDIFESTYENFHETAQVFNEVYGTVGFACILRKQELLAKKNVLKSVLEVYKKFNMVGFHSYGEQFASNHVNQTLTGVMFGRKKS